MSSNNILTRKTWNEVKAMHSTKQASDKEVFVYCCDTLNIPIMRCEKTGEPA